MGIYKKMNVCHIISGDLWAGAEAQMLTTVTALKSDPSINIIAIVLNEGKLAAGLRNRGFDVFIMDEKKSGFLQILSNLKGFLKDKEIEIIHSHRYKENMLAALAKKKNAVKYAVSTIHGTNENLKGIKKIKNTIYMMLNNYYLSNYFDILIAVSDEICRNFQKKAVRGKVMTIHNAVNLEEIKQFKPDIHVRERLKLKETDIIIGSIGRMVPVKQFGLFLEAASLIANENSSVKFILVGDGPDLPALKTKAIELKLKDKVVFTGFQDNIYQYVNIMDIFVLTSSHEGIPMALLEAMAMMKPIVSTNVGGIGEIVDNGNSGILVDNGDANGIKNACLEIIENLDYKNRLGKAALARIEERFSTGVMKNRMVDMYKQIICG